MSGLALATGNCFYKTRSTPAASDRTAHGTISNVSITVLLNAIEGGDLLAANQLLPLVYDELRRLASRRISDERSPQILQATALVHEAFVRLVDTNSIQHWKTRGHFFAAAAEAMRRILVENARRKHRIKHGGERDREEIDLVEIESAEPREDLIALDARRSTNLP